MQTDNLKIHDIIKDHTLPIKEGCWPCKIEIDLSSIKGVSPTKAFRISSHLYKLDCENTEEIHLTGMAPTDIIYRDKDGIWAVGDLAYALDDSQSAKDIDVEKEKDEAWYLSKEYKIYFSVAVGLSRMANADRAWNGEKFTVDLGLPKEYWNEFENFLKTTGLGNLDFDIKVGSGCYRNYKGTISPDLLPIGKVSQNEVMSEMDTSESPQDVDWWSAIDLSDEDFIKKLL